MVNSRYNILSNLKDKTYDLLIIGGGVIGKMLTGGFNDMTANTLISTVFKVRERNNLINKSSASTFGILYPIYFSGGKSGNSGLIRNELKANIYDLMSIFGKTKKHVSHSRNSVLETLPDLNNNDVIGATEFFEAKIDDSRYVLELLLKAKEYGADILNYAEVKAFDYNEKEINKTILSDKIDGKIYEISAKKILVAAGAWGDSIVSMLPKTNFTDKVKYVKATNFIVDSDIIHINKSVVLPKIKDRPNVFLTKWKDMTIIGPIAKKYTGNLDCIYSTSDEIEYLLDIYNTYFGSIVNKNHIVTSQSGMMTVNPMDMKIHSHPIYNLFMVEGGNFTMSSHLAIKTLLKMYGKPYKWFSVKKFMNNRIDKAVDWVLNKETIKFLIDYFGSVDMVLRLNEFCKDDSSLLVSVGLDNRIPRGLIKYFIEVEHAIHLDDIMMRRLRFILTENDCGTLLAEHIAQEMGYILGWDSKKVEYEIKRYRTEINRNRVSLY